jgi:cupin fold WbuC family metalloprotein
MGEVNNFGNQVPSLTNEEIKHYFDLSNHSLRRRTPKILHQKGDYLNKVFNFILEDSYMHPHLHPSDEKIEKMYLIDGSFALILFDNDGNIKDSFILKKGKKEFIEVPAYTWHTYVMLSDQVIIYETMEGQYEPKSWKELANWAPQELSNNSISYLKSLKEFAIKSS